MLVIIGRRLGLALPTLFAVSIVIFILLNILPGDPLAGLLAPDATKADRETLAHAVGLDLPLPMQYVTWLAHLVQGDMGQSFSRRQPVSTLIGTAFGNTVLLAATAAVLGLTTGVGLGFLAALRPGRWADRTISFLSTIGLSIPSYWLGLLLIIIFSATLKWLPSSGMGNSQDNPVDLLTHLIMPAIATSAVTVGMTARAARASVIETFGEDFVLTLRAKGLSNGAILWHVARNAAPPIMTVAGLQLGYLLGGSVLVETIFSWPGLGRLIYQAIQARDLRVIQAAVLVISVTFVLMNLCVDVLQVLVNPRLRRAT
ncbi:MAG: ABC transporter permease [Chloroflexota bacterium]